MFSKIAQILLIAGFVAFGVFALQNTAVVANAIKSNNNLKLVAKEAKIEKMLTPQVYEQIALGMMGLSFLFPAMIFLGIFPKMAAFFLAVDFLIVNAFVAMDFKKPDPKVALTLLKEISVAGALLSYAFQPSYAPVAAAAAQRKPATPASASKKKGRK